MTIIMPNSGQEWNVANLQRAKTTKFIKIKQEKKDERGEKDGGFPFSYNILLSTELVHVQVHVLSMQISLANRNGQLSSFNSLFSLSSLLKSDCLTEEEYSGSVSGVWVPSSWPERAPKCVYQWMNAATGRPEIIFRIYVPTSHSSWTGHCVVSGGDGLDCGILKYISVQNYFYACVQRTGQLVSFFACLLLNHLQRSTPFIVYHPQHLLQKHLTNKHFKWIASCFSINFRLSKILSIQRRVQWMMTRGLFLLFLSPHLTIGRKTFLVQTPNMDKKLVPNDQLNGGQLNSNTHLLCERNFPVEWPDPSQPGIGHLCERKKTGRDISLMFHLQYWNLIETSTGIGILTSTVPNPVRPWAYSSVCSP